MPIIIVGVGLWWFIRIVLLLFYAVVAFAYTRGFNVLSWIFRNQPYAGVFLTVLSVAAFARPFFKLKRKTKDGGETEMRKLAWFVVIVFAIVLGVAVACALNDPFKAAVSKGLSNLLGAVWTAITTQWSNLAITVGKSGTYFLIYTCSTLLFGGILLVALTRAKNSGRLPSIRRKLPASDVGFSSRVTTTPVGATTRPTSVTTPVTHLETTTVEEEESVEA